MPGLLSIVIPAYNEEKGLREILQRTLSVCSHLSHEIPQVSAVDLIVVNDGSNDQTAEVVQSFPQARLVNHSINQGYGAALKSGFAAAKGDLIAFLDADGTYLPESIPLLVRTAIESGADMVIGSRMSGPSRGMPRHRRAGNWFYAWLLSWVIGQKISDSTSGLRVFRKSILPTLQPLPDGLNFTPAMSTRALYEGLKLIEVPIPYEKRVGKSKLNLFHDGFRFLDSIFSTSRLYNPLKWFGAAGLLLIGLGLILSIQPIVYYLQMKRVEDTEIYRLFTIMVLFVTGINLVTFGAFSNYILEIFHGRELRQHSWIGKYLLRRSVVRRSDFIGLALMFSALALNHQTIIQYLTTGRIYVHWSYVLTGATLFLIGLQMLMSGLLIQIVEEFKETQTQRKPP